MNTDLIFIVGVGIAILAIPAIISAFLDGRTPRAPAMVIMIGAVMIGFAVQQRPMSYSVETIPDVLYRVIADFSR